MARLYAFKSRLPTPDELNVTVPLHVDEAMFKQGFRQGMTSNVLTDFRASFRAGFREAKRHLAYLQRKQGVSKLPVRQKLIVTYK